MIGGDKVEYRVTLGVENGASVTLLTEQEAQHIGIDTARYVGPEGKSAYEVAVKNGFMGSEEEWLLSLGSHAQDAEYAQIAGMSRCAAVAVHTGIVNACVGDPKLGTTERKFTLSKDSSTGHAEMTFDKTIMTASDTGFSIPIALVSQLHGRRILVYKEERAGLELSAVALNLVQSWGKAGCYWDVSPDIGQLKKLRDNWYEIDFDSYWAYAQSKNPLFTDDYDNPVYVMIYNNSGWNTAELGDDEVVTNRYGVYMNSDSGLNYDLVSGKMGSAVYAEQASRADQAANAVYSRNAGVEVISRELCAAYKLPEAIFDSERGAVEWPITAATYRAADAGFSLRIGTMNQLLDCDLVVLRDEAFPISNIAVNAGSQWGNRSYVEIAPLLKQVQGRYYAIAFSKVVALLKEKGIADETFKGECYLMIYGNTKWNLTILAEGETVYNRYAAYRSAHDWLNYQGMHGDLLEDKVAALEKELSDTQNALAALESGAGNVLWGKKWFVTGDSFTQGDFSNSVQEDYIFEDGHPFAGEKKVYPFFIGARNHMTIINDGLCGSILPLSKQYIAYRDGESEEAVAESYRSPFTLTRYQKIPADVDYITLWFGINDSGNTNLGTITDTTNETFYGAWNFILKHLISTYQTAKIGVIITNGASELYRKATRECCVKWGAPFLDLMGDNQIPPSTGGRESDMGLCAEAKALWYERFKVKCVEGKSNGHPCPEWHEFQSTFIEAFLRRL